MKKGILFDLDGTLWDSVPRLVEVYNKVLEKYPGTGPELDLATLRSYMGMNAEDLAAAVFPLVEDKAWRAELLEECFRGEEEHLLVHHGYPFPNLRETLETLKKDYTLAIVSNCQVGYVDIFLDTIGVREFFADQECSGNTGRPKGENIRMVLERNGIGKAIYVGDTLGDMKAADLAGVPFVHAAYGFGTPDRETEVIHGLTDLPALAAELLKD